MSQKHNGNFHRPTLGEWLLSLLRKPGSRKSESQPPKVAQPSEEQHLNNLEATDKTPISTRQLKRLERLRSEALRSRNSNSSYSQIWHSRWDSFSPEPRSRRGSFATNPLEDFDQKLGLFCPPFPDPQRESRPLEEIIQPAKTNGNSWSIYTYTQLKDDRAIRLIQIKSYDPSTQRLQLTLEEHCIDSSPPFDALSYTWGPPMYDDINICQSNDGGVNPTILGCQIECGNSSSMCQIASSMTSKYIWADAICIDQNNLAEKAAQVLMMGQIYARAERVIVWLGKDASDVLDFSHIRKNLLDAIRTYELYSEGSIESQNPLDPEFLDKILTGPQKDWFDMWRKYFLFYQRRRWFRRAWVVQEVALARDLVFLSGECLIHWRDMYEIGLTLRDSGWRHTLASILGPNARGGIGDEADRLLEYREQVQCGGPNDPQFRDYFLNIDGADTRELRWFAYLKFMIQEIRRFQVSDGRDKIFAVLGLAEKFLPDGLQIPIHPDYSLTSDYVYNSISKLFIKKLPFLSTLSFVEEQKRRRLLELPSWVPDYSSALGRQPLITLGSGRIFDASRAKSYRSPPPTFHSFQRSTTSPEIPILDTLQECITLQGAPLDRIPLKRISEPLDRLRLLGWATPVLKLCSELDRIYAPTGQSRIEALWRTLIADTGGQISDGPIHPAPGAYGAYFHDWLLSALAKSTRAWTKRTESESRGGYPYEIILLDEAQYLARLSLLTHLAATDSPARLSLLKHLAGTDRAAKAALPTIEQVFEHVEDFASQRASVLIEPYQKLVLPPCSKHFHSKRGPYHFDQAMGQVSTERCLFVTQKGYVGLGPESINPATDEIWLLMGAKVPFVLRRDAEGGSRYRLVGEVYLHGFMHGEALDTEVKERVGLVTIC
jgi:hypothetical protein